MLGQIGLVIRGQLRRDVLTDLRGRATARLDRLTVGRLARAFVWEVAEDDVPGMAAEMAYRFLFALFPLMLLLVAGLGFLGGAVGIDGAVDRLLGQAALFLPGPALQVLEEYLAGLLAARSSAFLTVGLLGTLWGAAGGVGTLIKGLNRAYDVERPRPFWRRQAIAVATTLTLPPTALALLVLGVLGRDAAAWLAAQLGLGAELFAWISLVRWPALVLLLFFGFSLMFHILPHTPHRYVWSLPGAAFATVAWVLLTQAFSLYLSRFADFEATYGSFGAVMAFLMWLYLAGLVVLLAAELNALLEPTQRKHWRALAGDESMASSAR